MSNEFPREGLGEPGAPLRLRAAYAAFLACYLATLLLNADALERGIKLERYGRLRDAGLALIRPAAALSRTLRLDRPRQWLEQTLGARLQHETIGL